MASIRLAAVLALTLAFPAFAAEPGPAPSPAQPAAKAKPGTDGAKSEEKLICTRETPVGSTIPKRTCRTQAQIDQDRADAQKMREQTGTGANLITPR